jgi:hypothetical protein
MKAIAIVGFLLFLMHSSYARPFPVSQELIHLTANKDLSLLLRRTSEPSTCSTHMFTN